jgi:N-acetylglucosamine-6-phosphate deacetylase
MTLALIADAVLSGDALVADTAVLVEGERIAGLVPCDAVPANAERIELPGATLVPGFVDTQVNGGGGVLFNDAPSVETIATIGAAHRRFGTTGFLPTLISDDLAVVARAVAAVDDAIAAGVPGVLGIHIEGPFLNVARRGIHAERHIRALDEEGFAAITGLRRGRTLVTLAPEMVDPATIRRLVAAGVIVAAGHTDGGYAEVRAGLDAGITGFTHLFNAMSPLQTRAPGAVGAALESDAWCGLIVDGHHVDPVTMRLGYRLKGADRIMLVSDAMPSVGAADKDFVLQGEPVTADGGILRGPDGTLAGADLDMAAAVRNAVTMLGVDLPTAIRMASATPTQFLQLDHLVGRVAPGLRADMVALDRDGYVLRTWIAGH